MIKLGSYVTSTWHPYDREIVCIVDRIYLRTNEGGASGGIPYCRLAYAYKGEDRTCNVPMKYCVLNAQWNRNKKLEELFKWE